MTKDVPSAHRILLVDDNPHGLNARRQLLAEEGFEVAIAMSGEQAWDMFIRAPFDVVVTDFRMGEMNGVDLIARIHAADSPARTILLSGFVACLGMTERSTGADQVIEKSNREGRDLLRAVKKLLAHPPRRRGPKAQASGAGAGAELNQTRAR